MIVIVSHDRQYTWRTLAPGESSEGYAKVRRVRPDYPEPVEVLDLKEAPGNATLVMIPDEEIARMTADWNKEGDSRQEALARHIVHAVHHAERAPISEWTEITANNDPELTEFLRQRVAHLKEHPEEVPA